MSLVFRIARPDEFPLLERMIIDTFEPITWFRIFDERFGAPKGCDWRTRWKKRLEKVWESQIILVGELDGSIVAAATGTYDTASGMGFVDLLGVEKGHQGRGFGREMLRGIMDHFRSLGGVAVHLECLLDNDTGNALYRSEGFQEVARSIRWLNING